MNASFIKRFDFWAISEFSNYKSEPSRGFDTWLIFRAEIKAISNLDAYHMLHMPSFDMTSFDFLGHFKDPRYNFKIQPRLSEIFFCYKISILSPKYLRWVNMDVWPGSQWYPAGMRKPKSRYGKSTVEKRVKIITCAYRCDRKLNSKIKIKRGNINYTGNSHFTFD